MPYHSRSTRHRAVAVALSLLFPGLGQLYNRDWRKGGLFVLGGLLTGFGPLQPIDTSAVMGDPIAGLRATLLAALPFLALVVWSAIDAYRLPHERSN